MRCIVGLGNPGKSYEFTRHNVGFLMIEALRKLWGFPEWKDSSFHGVISEGTFQGKKIILLKPMTFMNLSGDAVHPLIQFYKLDVSKDILVISDDLDMEFAKVRYRLQ